LFKVPIASFTLPLTVSLEEVLIAIELSQSTGKPSASLSNSSSLVIVIPLSFSTKSVNLFHKGLPSTDKAASTLLLY